MFIVIEVYNMVINPKAIILSSSQSLNPLLNEVKKIKTETSIKERKYSLATRVTSVKGRVLYSDFHRPEP